MANYCYFAPILPGTLEKWKAYIRDEEINNANHDRVNKAIGVTREQVWLQHTPMGDFAVVSIEADDPGRSMKLMASSSDPWAVRFRKFLSEVHGIDFSKIGEPNEQLVDWCIEERVLG
jgi:hypothetical protein